MGFGINTGISRQSNHSVEVAEKLNATGNISEMTTHHGVKEVTEEYYEDSFVNSATPGQTGSSSIVTQHNLIEVNNDYSREQKTTRSAISS